MKMRIVQTGLMLFILLSVLYPLSTSIAELKIGENAPEFKATDQEGKIVDLSDLRGKWVVLYFYPKDFTPGCTIEAKQFTELYEDFLKANALVYGISTDGKERHCDFRDRYKLKVPLIPDQERKIMSLYGVKVFLGFASRDTVVIDPSGKIAKIYRKASAIRNPKEALDFIKDSSKGGTIL
jgi:thioredoxin-dependent peroxiredoxin